MWWPRTERLEWELQALADSGFEYEMISGDPADLGELHIRVTYPMEDGIQLLDVYFPLLFPFFRFHIDAPGLDLPHHQNPFEHNLCLIGRGTDQWSKKFTLAEFLKAQVPRVLSAGLAQEAEAARGIEQVQAEPFSEYYPYGNST